MNRKTPTSRSRNSKAQEAIEVQTDESTMQDVNIKENSARDATARRRGRSEPKENAGDLVPVTESRKSDFQDKAKEYAASVKQTTGTALQKFNNEYIEGTKLDGYITTIDRTIGFMVPRKEYEYDNPVVKEASGPIRFGLWMFFFIFGVCFLWAALAPIDSATVAQGAVVLDANRKTVDHLEGGLVKEIYVKDGDTVKAGQLLLRLDEVAAKARLEITEGQFLASKAAEDRLMAERDDMDKVTFSEELTKYADRPEVQKVMDSQERIFKTRVESFISQNSIIDQRINQLNEEIEGLRAQERATESQLELINEEVGTVKTLLAKGQALKPRLLSLQRAAADLLGKQGEYKALIAKAGQSIGENQMTMLNMKNDRLKEIVAQLREAQVQVADLRERVTAARDIMNRIEVIAPQSGIVTGLRFHTKGGVIPPNSPILEIVPQDDTLVIDAQVRPQDIDVVRAGLSAKVRLSAYSARTVPLLDGTVQYVSADRFIDQKSGAPYFIARVHINEKEVGKLTQKVDLYPGMPADVLIVTGERTLFGYLSDPITHAMDRAFKEQ